MDDWRSKMAKKQRNLDGIYFRVERDGKMQNVCYSDMEQRERDEIARKKMENSTPAEQAQWWRSMADILADQLYVMGEHLGVTCE